MFWIYLFFCSVFGSRQQNGVIPAIFYASDSLWFDFFSPCPDSEPLDYTFMKYNIPCRLVASEGNSYTKSSTDRYPCWYYNILLYIWAIYCPSQSYFIRQSHLIIFAIFLSPSCLLQARSPFFRLVKDFLSPANIFA